MIYTGQMLLSKKDRLYFSVFYFGRMFLLHFNMPARSDPIIPLQFHFLKKSEKTFFFLCADRHSFQLGVVKGIRNESGLLDLR